MPVVIDPYLIAIPQRDFATPDRIRTYAQSLVEWEKEFVEHTQDYVVSLLALNAINQAGLMPTIPALQQLFDRWGIEEYSPRDIVPDCNTYLANCQYLEEVSGAMDSMPTVERIKGSESVIPEEMRDRLAPTVADAFIESLIYAACALEARHCIGDGWSIATAPLQTASPDTDLKTAATVRKIIDNAERIVDARVERKWPLLIEPDYLYAGYEVSRYFEDPLMATRITWCKLKAKGSRVKAIDWNRVSFGDHFVGSLTDLRIRQRPTYKRDIEEVYFMVVEVLQGLPFGSDKHHALRKPVWSRSAPIQKRPTRTSDGALRYDEAARVEVTTGPSPLRLHYWRCYDGSYEFSNITSEHDDPTIY